MEAIKIESKKTQPKTNKKTLADFAGKMNSNINWIAYQKKIRNEWN